MIDFSAGVSVECADFSVASIELSGHLSGTSPWRIRGHASISILWWDVDVDIPEITWGDANPPPLPPARDPAAVLAHELGVPGNWAALSREVPHLVQLRPGVERRPRRASTRSPSSGSPRPRCPSTFRSSAWTA